MLKSLRLIPALRVDMSSWSEAISKSVMELLDRKLLVSQMVIVSAVVILELVALYVYSMTWIPVLWVARNILLLYDSISTGTSGEPGQYVISDHTPPLGRNFRLHPDAAQTFPSWSTDIADTGSESDVAGSKSGLNDESIRDCELIEPSCLPIMSLFPDSSTAKLVPVMSESIWIIPGDLHPQVSAISLSRWIRSLSRRL